MKKCKNCVYGDILEVFKRDRVTKVKTQVPCDWALCSRPGRKNIQTLPVKETRISCVFFVKPEGQEEQN